MEGEREEGKKGRGKGEREGEWSSKKQGLSPLDREGLCFLYSRGYPGSWPLHPREAGFANK